MICPVMKSQDSDGVETEGAATITFPTPTPNPTCGCTLPVSLLTEDSYTFHLVTREVNLTLCNYFCKEYIYRGWTMKLKHLVLDHNNLLVWCRASFCGQYSVSSSWE
ncbi:hypothetical protein ILYODFUR_011051 [Ilyodon furcidens]|uniref:Uncharacterized protein n=1 Tax=Ilyodon furcidens TaxID=33524 RepID=A0ABV0U747_9TELE